MRSTTPRATGATAGGLPAVPDVTVENHGSIFLFFPWSDRAKEWVMTFTPPGPETQYFGPALAVEARFAPAIAEGMQESGLELR